MTQRKGVYLALAIIGTAVPYSQVVPWIVAHGFDLRLLVQQLFANRISAFFGVDVIISAVVLLVFISHEARSIRHWWLPVLATLLVGVSSGLPLLLYLREQSSSSQAAST